MAELKSAACKTSLAYKGFGKARNKSSKRPLNPPDLLKLAARLAIDMGLTERDVHTIESRFQQEGTSFLTKTLPLLGKALDKGLGSGVFKLPSQFKKITRSSEIPAFGGSLFRHVFDKHGSLHVTVDHIVVRNLRTFFYFFYKASSSFTDEQVGSTIRNFISNEIYLRGVYTPQALERLAFDPLVKRAKKLFSEIFNDFDWSCLRLKHGPGVVSNCSITEKWSKPVELTYEQFAVFGSYFYLNSNDQDVPTRRRKIIAKGKYFKLAKSRPRLRRELKILVSKSNAKVMLVPKDSRGPRIISSEPCEHQFMQQGIMGYMVRKLESHPLTRGMVNFTDQSINQELALHTSISRRLASLDLKDASDLIANPLVKEISSGTDLGYALQVARSSHTQLPCGTKIPLMKFAPMGSATCFPVLAVVIYLLLVSALIQTGLNVGRASKMVFVYGDDLIVEKRFARVAMGVLERYGLKTNVDKSFVGGRFAESCGTDAFDGNVVTPVRLRETCSISSNPRSVASYLSTANKLSDIGAEHSSKLLYDLVEDSIGRLPYGSIKSPYLCKVVPSDVAWTLNLLEGRVYSRKGRRYIVASALRAPRKHFDEDPYAFLRRRLSGDAEQLNFSWTCHPYFLHGYGGWDHEVEAHYFSDTFVRYGEYSPPKTAFIVKRKFSELDI